MGGGKKSSTSLHLMFALACLSVVAAGCNEQSSKPESNAVFDSSRLPRVSGAKEIFASPATTNFTSPDSVAQTSDNLEKALSTAGWQKFVVPNTATASDPKMRMLSMKKGAQALMVFISVAPAQNNATSVQYSALPLKNDLPFPKDAASIQFNPDKPLLMLTTGEPVDKTLEFYRKELEPLGWSLWSQALNGPQPAGGTAGVLTRSGAYAYYVRDNKRLALLQLERAGNGPTSVKFDEQPAGMLAHMQSQYFNSDNIGTPPVDVGQLPRLDGAKPDSSRSSADRMVYSVTGTLADTIAAVNAKLGADGWKPYVAPLDDVHATLSAFKKGRQGLSVSYTIEVGKNERTSNVTTVYYSPVHLNFALPVPADASDIVYDQNRPYLNLTSAGSVDATLEFFKKELGASGWQLLSAADLAAKWPNAKTEDKPANGASAYFARGDKRVIVLTLQPANGKSSAEIKVPAFAEPQTLEAGQDIYGLPKPKLIKTAGGTDRGSERLVHAHVPASVGTVLAFYRRELGARNWKEETQGAVIKPEEAALTFTSPAGKAVLKLSRKYDLTIVSLVQQVAAAPAAKAGPASGGDSIADMMKDAQQMMRDAAADIAAANKSQKSAQAPAQPSSQPSGPLRAQAGNKTPIPLPEDAAGIEFDRDDGRLEFSSPSSVASVAAFYRSVMKPLGWKENSTVINQANMSVLNFTKGSDEVELTIMRMGAMSNVTAEGSVLKSAGSKAAAASPAKETAQQATADDLIAEESGGLPVPKRRTMASSEKNPFRRELNANVPLNLNDVLGFYRRELGKLNWKEESKGQTITAERVEITYTAPEGPASLTLGRKNGETTVKLSTRNPGEAAKAGVLPKPGQAKFIFGNILPSEASITFNGKTIKIAGGAGTKAPDGQMLDLAPGKYKYSISVPGKPSQNEEVEAGADQTWGLMVGPGGILALQVY